MITIMYEKLKNKLKALFKFKETKKEKLEKVLKELESKADKLRKSNTKESKKKLDVIESLIKKTQIVISEI